MAEFSKQYCEMNDPGFPWDFDIEKEAEALEPEFGIPIICEGFGFTMIAKDTAGEIVLGFPDRELTTLEWVPYLQFIQEQREKL